LIGGLGAGLWLKEAPEEPVAIRLTIAAASNGSQTLPLPKERNLAWACGPRQMRRYLLFFA
jgi:hypothetical protein